MTDRPRETVGSQFSTPSGSSYLIHAFEHRAYPLLEEESFWIGRGSQCDILISEVFVSRQHAEIRAEGSEFVIHPVGATPTLVNDTEIHQPKVLREGDVINIGTMRFIFTRDKLPVAMSIADPWLKASRLYDAVSDRRPTLTFPVQTVPQGRAERPEIGKRWVWLIVVAIIALGIAYLVMTQYFAG